ncbi:MAG: molybdopterin-binding protein [Gammaproteobacteria bacterium]
MEFGIIVIGDELLSGRRQDRHFEQSVRILGQHGLTLAWCRIIGDDERRITATLRETLDSDDAVFSFGGIGATPDDLTRRCAARAAGRALVRHPRALAEIEAQFGEAAYPHRVLMADLPEGCELIPNPYNRVPGFTLERHHFLPGFPQLAWPMMEWVLLRYYTDQFQCQPPVQDVFVVYDVHESQLMDLMESFVKRHPDVRLSSLPTMGAERRRIELGVRGAPEPVRVAADDLAAALDRGGLTWERAT